jgi:hypothetical protein
MGPMDCAVDKKSRISIVVLLAASTAVAFAVGPAAAAAKVTVKTVAIKSGSKARLLVTITNSARFTSRTKPRAVTVKYRTKKYGLRHVAGTASAGASTGATSQWQSSSSSSFNALVGKRVSVLVRATAKTSTFSQTVTQQTGPGTTMPGGGPNPGSGPLFTPPGRELSGNEAFNSFSRYFLNSRFTDCPAGWPNCSVEERYVHCPNGGWQYHRYTPTSGSDINSYGTFQVTGAAQHADGSWVVEYNETAYGYTHFYHWEVSTNGSTVGSYDGSPLGIAFKWEPGPGTSTSC